LLSYAAASFPIEYQVCLKNQAFLLVLPDDLATEKSEENPYNPNAK